MNKYNLIRSICDKISKAGEEVTVNNVITHSLFQPHGTLTEQDEEEILSVFWDIREQIERRVNRSYAGITENIGGLRTAIACNAYFNYKSK